jgi:hypothetical protein
MAALMIAALPSAVLADTLVVRSSGPSARSYPPGKSIPETQKIVLKADDTVVILDGGGTRTLKGPGSFSPAKSSAQATDSRASFAALVNQRSERRARIGAVRGAPVANPTMARSPNLWFVDIERSSNTCVTDSARVTMWRSEPSNAASVTLTRIADGKSETLDWTAGQAMMLWPTTMPVAQGAEYRISWPGMTQPTSLKFAVLGPNPQGLEDMAAALIRNGCEAQLDLLIETVAIPDASSSPAG